MYEAGLNIGVRNKKLLFYSYVVGTQKNRLDETAL